MDDFKNWLDKPVAIPCCEKLGKTIARCKPSIDDSLDAMNYAMEMFNKKIPLRREKIELIYRKPATILIVGKRKFVSKAHDEEFDKEKGLLMCLAKYFGITHLQLKRLMKTAKDQTPKSED